MKGYLLGIDNGGSFSKAAIFDTEGHEITVASRKVKIIQPFPGWNERDADEMWKDTCDIINKVIHKSGIDSCQISGVGCTGHGNGLYLADEYGNPVRNAINSTDNRAQKYIEEWEKAGIDKKILPLTAQSIWAGQPNALLRWLKDNEPNILEKSKWILMAKDYTRMKLTGEFLAEITDMSGTSLMDVCKRSYNNEVLRFFDLEEIRELLPPLIGSADIAGRVSEKAASETGLKAGTPVAGGMFDIDACALASGVVDEKQMSLVVGTWGNNQYISKQPIIDKDLFMTSIYCIPGWYLMLEGSPTSAGNLDWFINNFLQNEMNKMGDDFFSWLENQVNSVAPEPSGVIFLPFLYGCNAGKDLPASFYGIKSEHTRAHLIRAVYEGIIFSHKTHIEHLLKFREAPGVIRCSGSATQSPVWMQMFADIIGIPVEITKGTQSGTLGAAMAAAVCCGLYSSFEEAVNAMVKKGERYDPDTHLRDIYYLKFKKYLNYIQNYNPYI
jgi:L-xylulokinase